VCFCVGGSGIIVNDLLECIGWGWEKRGFLEGNGSISGGGIKFRVQALIYAPYRQRPKVSFLHVGNMHGEVISREMYGVDPPQELRS